jgi:hypothetical protein
LSACMFSSPIGWIIGILGWGVARRSLCPLRFDLWLQIDPFASGSRAGYILRQ